MQEADSSAAQNLSGAVAVLILSILGGMLGAWLMRKDDTYRVQHIPLHVEGRTVDCAVGIPFGGIDCDWGPR